MKKIKKQKKAIKKLLNGWEWEPHELNSLNMASGWTLEEYIRAMFKFTTNDQASDFA